MTETSFGLFGRIFSNGCTTAFSEFPASIPLNQSDHLPPSLGESTLDTRPIMPVRTNSSAPMLPSSTKTEMNAKIANPIAASSNSDPDNLPDNQPACERHHRGPIQHVPPCV